MTEEVHAPRLKKIYMEKCPLCDEMGVTWVTEDSPRCTACESEWGSDQSFDDDCNKAPWAAGGSASKDLEAIKYVKSGELENAVSELTELIYNDVYKTIIAELKKDTIAIQKQMDKASTTLSVQTWYEAELTYIEKTIIQYERRLV